MRGFLKSSHGLDIKCGIDDSITYSCGSGGLITDITSFYMMYLHLVDHVVYNDSDECFIDFIADLMVTNEGMTFCDAGEFDAVLFAQKSRFVAKKGRHYITFSRDDNASSISLTLSVGNGCIHNDDLITFVELLGACLGSPFKVKSCSGSGRLFISFGDSSDAQKRKIDTNADTASDLLYMTKRMRDVEAGLAEIDGVFIDAHNSVIIDKIAFNVEIIEDLTGMLSTHIKRVREIESELATLREANAELESKLI